MSPKGTGALTPSTRYRHHCPATDRAKVGPRDWGGMVKLVQFMVRAEKYDHEEFVDVDATERMIVEETVHVDR